MNLKSRHLKNFINEIQYKNRNPRDTRALMLLDDLSTNPERILDVGEKLYRCRIIKDEGAINKDEGFFGYNAKDSFVPPPSVTTDMRANYRYIPYLYCANHPYTAVVEVRPRLTSKVSVATLTVEEPLRLLDFTMLNASSRMSEAKQNLFYDLSELYSKPVTNDDDTLDYIPTQYIAEYVKYLGYDGIAHKSSLTPEVNENEIDRYNIVVFNYNKCRPIRSNVFEVISNTLEFRKIDASNDSFKIESLFDEQLDELIKIQNKLLSH